MTKSPWEAPADNPGGQIIDDVNATMALMNEYILKTEKDIQAAFDFDDLPSHKKIAFLYTRSHVELIKVTMLMAKMIEIMGTHGADPEMATDMLDQLTETFSDSLISSMETFGIELIKPD